MLTCLFLAVLGFRLVPLSLSLSRVALSSVLLVFVIPPARVRCRLARQSGNVGRGLHSPGGSAMICGALIKPSLIKGFLLGFQIVLVVGNVRWKGDWCTECRL